MRSLRNVGRTRPVMTDEPVEMLPDGGALARWLGAAGLFNERESVRLMRRWAVPEFSAAIEELRQFRKQVRQVVLKMEAERQPAAGRISLRRPSRSDRDPA
jgi:hypothetical protein